MKHKPFHISINVMYRQTQSMEVITTGCIYHIKVLSALPKLQCESKTNQIRCLQCNKDMALGSEFTCEHTFRSVILDFWTPLYMSVYLNKCKGLKKKKVNQFIRRWDIPSLSLDSHFHLELLYSTFENGVSTWQADGPKNQHGSSGYLPN